MQSHRTISSIQHHRLELLHQAKATLIYHHITTAKGTYKPVLIRTELENSIRLFPNNTIFLSLHAATERHSNRLNDRVRSIMRDQVFTNEDSSVVRWSFAVSQEIARFESSASGSTAEAVRATFSRALLRQGSRVTHSQELWNMWFQFEERVLGGMLSDKNTRKKDLEKAFFKIRTVFLDGLRILPWVKAWALMGLKFFDREDEWSWSGKELKGLYDVMQERELRIRVEGLDDMIDEIK